MRLYRFSPIENKKELIEAIKHIHIECHKLCKQAVGRYLPVSGNVGVFCHYEKEYENLRKLREKLTRLDDHFNQKYFRLYEPIVISKKNGVPGGVYTYLYVRQPDPYRSQVGDVDFYLEPEEYRKLKQRVKRGEVRGARIFPRADLDMIELWDPEIDCLGFVTSWKMVKK